MMDLFGAISGVGKKGKGAALYPFIFVRNMSFINPVLINHELIHFKQQVETLFIGSFLLNIFERLYTKFFLKKDAMTSYTWASAEQEAYRNQNNLNYLKSRKLWSQFFYIKNKKIISFPKPGTVVIK